MDYNHNPQESLENKINTIGYTVRDTPKLSLEKDPFLIFEDFFSTLNGERRILA